MKIIIRITFLLTILLNVNMFAQDKMESLRKEAESMKTAGVISVSIGGDFFINGTFSAFLTERLDHFLTRVLYASIGGNNGDDEGKNMTASQQISSLLDETIKRNIRLIRSDKSEQIIDLEKFYLTGDITYNPYLKMDDILIFQKINIETNYVIVDGAVKKRLKFPFVEGDRLSDALLFAHGIDNAYKDVHSAEIFRLSNDGNISNRDTVNLKYAESYILQPGDVIRVLSDIYNKKDFKILVVGEVNKPGYIYITKDKTTLREVLKLAGGIKDNAWLEYSELVRANTPERKVTQELITSAYTNGYADNSMSQAFRPNAEWENWKMFRTANLYDDYNNIFRLDAQLAIMSKNKLVDFSKLADNNAKEFDFIVDDGDVIYIPEKADLVYVMGQVVNSGQFPFVEGNNFQDYINNAGGFSNAADGESEVYVLQGKTYNWIHVDEHTIIKPGDYIWVRKDPTRSFNFYLARVSAVTSIIGSIATIVLLVTQLIK